MTDEASRDYLTGLLNRRGLRTAMESLRREDLPLAVYLFDLDDLKKTNDACGHEMGDRLVWAHLLRGNRSVRPSSVLIERADRAVYRAKRDNKGGCCLWESSDEGNTAE